MSATETTTPPAQAEGTPDAEQADGATTTAPPPAEEGERLKRILERGQNPFEEDGSYIADVKKAGKALSEVDSALVAYKEADEQGQKATERFMVATFDLREVCHRGDNDVPDWAGRTRAYRVLYAERISSQVTAAGLSDAGWKRLQDNVRGMIRDRDYTRQRMARYAISSNSEVATAVKAETGDKPVSQIVKKGAEITEALAEAINKQKAAQVATTGRTKGQPLQGFEPDVVAGTKFGEKPTTTTTDDSSGSSGSAPESVGNVGQDTAKRAFDTLVTLVTDSPSGVSLSAVDTLQEIHRVISALVKAQMVGVDNERTPKPKGGVKSTADELGKIAALTTAAQSWLTEQPSKPTREQVTALYFS